MKGHLCFILHAHLPFVRHPEHDQFLEETWLYEALTDTYLPLLDVLDGWEELGMTAPLTLSLSPALCSMLADPLLRDRCALHLQKLVELAEKEVYRTFWDKRLAPLAELYLARFRHLLERYEALKRNILTEFVRFQKSGILEIITTAATHALLPLLHRRSSVRAQILVARDHHELWFGQAPKGIWLPECAYAPGLDEVLKEAGIQWFVAERHGVMNANPRPRYGVFAPLLTPNGVAAFGRDLESAAQVWSRDQGYPGDPRYRDFYRDAGFDLDLEYLRPYLPAAPHRTFTGIKYWRITGPGKEKQPYDPGAAKQAAAEHAGHFMEARLTQIGELASAMDRPPILVCPYDAELFGHWWHEGPQFLDYLFRKLHFDQKQIQVTTPTRILAEERAYQVAEPSPSSWGEEGHWKVWLNETNEWMYRHLHLAEERMSALANRHRDASGLVARALNQAGRELLLAQSSDWAFILRTGTSPEYARTRVTDHLLRFHALHEQLTSTRINEPWLTDIESKDNLFPKIDYRYWM